jgi:gamma-glutamyl-gamma-aminobutyrate hydrolase PuuD
LHLKDKLSKGKIELATAKWTKAITNIKSVYVSEPIYVNEASDRVDALVLTGGFNTTDLTVFLQKKAAKVKSEAVKKGLLKEKEWENITKSLTAQ